MGKDLKVYVGYFEMDEDARRVINEVLDAGRISEGKYSLQFENEFAKYCRTSFCTVTTSGTAALQAGLTAMRFHSKYAKNFGKRVITTPLTYIATANAITFAGYKPAFADIDPVRFSLLPEKVEELINERGAEQFAAIMPVHLMGYPVNMERMLEIGEKYDIPVIEDSAQAHGSMYDGKPTGSMGLFGAFSFYIAHNIQAGEMGAVTTNDRELQGLLKQVKANGRMCDCPVCTRPQGYCPHQTDIEDEEDFDPRFTHTILGLNFKTMDFQAALGLFQLKKAKKIFQARLAVVKYLNENLAKYESILQLPEYDEKVSYLAYPLVLKKDAPISRKKLRYELEANGVETRPLFGAIPTQQPAYKEFKDEYKDKIPNADFIGRYGFYIGCHQYLTQAHLEKIVKTFRKVLG